LTSSNNNIKKRKKAHAAFSKYQKKAEKTCKKINQIDDQLERQKIFEKLIQDIPNLLDNFGDLLSKQLQEELEDLVDSYVSSQIPMSECIKLASKIRKTLDELQLQTTDASMDDTSKSSANSTTSTSGTGTSISTKMIVIIISGIVVGGGAGAVYFFPPDTPQPSYPSPDTSPPPSPSIISPYYGDTITDTNSITFTWNSSYDNSGIDHYFLKVHRDVDNSLIFNGDVYSTSYSNLSLGYDNYYWQILAVDNAGNTGSFSSPAYFTIVKTEPEHPPDNIPPIIEVPNNITRETSSNGTPINFQATANDNVDGTITASCSQSSGSMFSIGTTTVRCEAFDKAGNKGTASFTVTVTERPVEAPIAIMDCSSGVIPGDEVKCDASGSYHPDGTSIIYSWNFGDGKSVLDDPYPETYHAYDSPGTYIVTLTVTDKAGNKDTASFTVTVIVPPLPTPILDTPSNGAILYIIAPENEALVEFTWSDLSYQNDNIRYDIEIDGQIHPWGPTTEPRFELPFFMEGIYSWRVRAIDTSGNVGPFSEMSYFEVKETTIR